MSKAHERASLTHYLDGDLLQMSSQANFLASHGITIGVSGGIPGVHSEDDWKRAVALIWEHKVPGWWNYRDALIAHGHCSAQEYAAKLRLWNG